MEISGGVSFISPDVRFGSTFDHIYVYYVGMMIILMLYTVGYDSLSNVHKP